MNPIIYLFGIIGVCLMITVSTCSDNINEPKQSLSSLEQAKVFDCQVRPFDPQAVPLDCYSWGRTEQPGDNQSLNYHAIQAWWQAVSLDPDAPADSNGLIEIDFAMLLEIDTASNLETVIDFLDYDTDYPKFLSLNEGGSFSRWYTDNSSMHLTNTVIEDGVLKIRPAIFPNRVSHWWLNSSGKYSRRSDCRYFVKCRVRISGAVAIQIAADYYLDQNSNFPDNKEAFHSPWYSDTHGEFKIFCYPPK